MIKIYSLWRLKSNFQGPSPSSKRCISHGIWEVVGLSDLNTTNPLITLRCRLGVEGDTLFEEVKMIVPLLEYLCQEVMIIDVDDNIKEIIRYKKLKRLTDEK